MTRIGVSIALAAVLSLGAVDAKAQGDKDYRGSQQQQEACTPDVHRLCEAVIPDERRIVSCLRTNVWKLSPACRKVFSRR
ncbi:MAG: cysteine rich repeat-containing protein [Rhodomicrobium sp.]